MSTYRYSVMYRRRGLGNHMEMGKQRNGTLMTLIWR